MTKCIDCRKLVNNHCVAYEQVQQSLGRNFPPYPLGACIIPIVENYLSYIKNGMRVLDVGCGSWDLIKNHCQYVGADYEGIDVRENYFGKKVVATRIENLANLSFPDNYFDFIIGNQTMEHWLEYGCTVKWGLYQCFRVLKFNGRLLLNVPIHFHGTRHFMLGNVEVLRKYYAPFSSKVGFNVWGKPSYPLLEIMPWPGYWTLRYSSAYILDIQAEKNLPLPKRYSNFGAFNGKLAQLIHYPFSFNLYRVLRKMKVV